MKRIKLTIEKLDGTKEIILSDAWDKEKDLFTPFGLTGIGYRIKYENGREMFIHPNSVFRLIVDEIQDEIETGDEAEAVGLFLRIRILRGNKIFSDGVTCSSNLIKDNLDTDEIEKLIVGYIKKWQSEIKKMQEEEPPTIPSKEEAK